MISRKLFIPVFISFRSYSKFQLKPLLSWKHSANKDTDNRFINSHIIKLASGNGGNGISCFSGLFLKEFAGPDGGSGGKGGDIIIQASRKVSSLGHLKERYSAGNGLVGRSTHRTGKSGNSIFIKVPLRTRICEVDDGLTLALLEKHGEECIVAYGGCGGRGNAEFLTNENRAPDVWEKGDPGQVKAVQLEMEKFADFGLVGMPNAGKSSLLRAVSRAYPRVADYPFTTLFPQLGVVDFNDHCIMCLAEIPGLIEGSWQNKGHGRFFLKHAKACECLLLMIDLLSEIDAITQLNLLISELDTYNNDLVNNIPFLIAANKIDSAMGIENWVKFNKILKRKFPEIVCIPISVREKINIVKLLVAMRSVLDKAYGKKLTNAILEPET